MAKTDLVVSLWTAKMLDKVEFRLDTVWWYHAIADGVPF